MVGGEIIVSCQMLDYNKKLFLYGYGLRKHAFSSTQYRLVGFNLRS